MAKKINKVDVNKYNEFHELHAAKEQFNTDYDLQAQFKKLTSMKEELDRQLNEVRTKLYEQGVSEKVNPYIHKWVKIPGTMSTDEYENEKECPQYRIFYVEGFKNWMGGDCVYLKISNLITFTQSKPDKEITVKFGGYNLGEYRIDDINHLKVLTKEQAERELTKISTLMFKNFAKVIKSDELENYHVKKANKN